MVVFSHWTRHNKEQQGASFKGPNVDMTNLHKNLQANQFKYTNPPESYSLQPFLKDINAYSTIGAIGTASAGLEPAAIVLGGVAC